MQCSNSCWTVFNISLWREFCDGEKQWIFAKGDHQLDTRKVLSVGGAWRQLSICFEAEIHERRELMGSAGLLPTPLTFTWSCLSPQMLCHPVTVTLCWEDISAKHWLVRLHISNATETSDKASFLAAGCLLQTSCPSTLTGLGNSLLPSFLFQHPSNLYLTFSWCSKGEAIRWKLISPLLTYWFSQQFQSKRELDEQELPQPE